MPEPTFCRVCKAVFKDGRWQWADFRPERARETVCQACTRARAGYPAGEILLHGRYATEHKPEILNLVRNIEQHEKAEHALHRIMKIEERGDSILVQTTDTHLPRRIGEALRRAHKGELTFDYEEEGYFTRVNWMRD